MLSGECVLDKMIEIEGGKTYKEPRPPSLRLRSIEFIIGTASLTSRTSSQSQLRQDPQSKGQLAITTAYAPPWPYLAIVIDTQTEVSNST